MERVKLYILPKIDDDWKDEGTGYLKLEPRDESDNIAMVVQSEDSSEILLNHETGVTTTEYTLKADSRIIQWIDKEADVHRALSFESDSHCREIFRKLREKCPKSTVEEDEEVSSGEKPVPELTLSSLEDVAKTFSDGQVFARGCPSSVVSQLVDVFQQCEDLEDLPSLENCCRLARNLVLHADFTTAEDLFSDDNALHIIGALEYDPDIPVRIKHRQFLQEKVKFKAVMPIQDPDIIRRIHRIYRMQYVKDVVLTRFMDEPVYSCITHLIMVGHMEVVNGLSSQSGFFEELFSKIREYDVASEEWRDLVGFLQEYCTLLRNLQPVNLLTILVKMNNAGLFSVLTDILKRGSVETQLKAFDTLNSSLTQDPSLLRNFIIKTHKDPLFQILAEKLVTGDVMGLREHCLEVIRSLLEPAADTADLNDAFRDMFYKNYAPYLIDALSPTPPRSSEKSKAVSTLKVPEKVSPRARATILELLSYCGQAHTYDVKCCFLRERVFDRVVPLLRSKERWLVASVVRFFRVFVGMADEFYDRNLQRADVLGHVVDAFLENGDRNNLLNSSILELFDHLRTEKRHFHIAHFVEHHIHKVIDITYVNTFKELKNEYDKKKEGGESLDNRDTSMVDSSRMKRESREMEREEEDYFAEGGDDKDEEASRDSRVMDHESDTISSERCKRASKHDTDLNASPKRLRSEKIRSTSEAIPDEDP